MTNSFQTSLELTYGAAGRFVCQIDAQRIVEYRQAPPACNDVSAALRAALAQPLDFPPLAQAVVPGDHLVLALDRHTPQAPTLVAEIWKVLESRQIEPEDVTVLQPAALERGPLPDPRGQLPASVSGRVCWKTHDPLDESQRGYLASTANGERVYLARELIEADCSIAVGMIAFDPVLGVRGTSSVFFPGLSTVEAVTRSHGLGHSELEPNDERPLRQMIDEIAWLLGTQFAVQVVSASQDRVFSVLAGASEPVFRCGKQLLAEHCQIALEQRVPLVVVAVDADAAGHGWPQIGAALATAQNLVEKGGKIVVLSELAAELDQGMKLIADSKSPRNALQPLRKLAPPDLVAASQLATTADWARVYLLSQLEGDLVERLFMTPLSNEREVARLLKGDDECVFVESAQHTYGRIGKSSRVVG